MATVTVNPGVCGLKSTIKADSEDMQNAVLNIESQCSFIQAMAKEIKEVDGFTECFGKLGDGTIYQSAKKYCKHASCPVVSGILKSVEVACGLALPADVNMKISKD